MRFTNDFHSWLRHSWKSVANRLTRDPNIVIHSNSCIILYIAHPWCLQPILGIECIHWGWSTATAWWGQGQLLGVKGACGYAPGLVSSRLDSHMVSKSAGVLGVRTLRWGSSGAWCQSACLWLLDSIPWGLVEVKNRRGRLVLIRGRGMQ